MEKVNDTPLFDSKAAQYVLGALMHQPELLVNNSDKYILTVTDFEPNSTYRFMFGGIYNLCYTGTSLITPEALDLYLSAFANQYERYCAVDGRQLIELIFLNNENIDSRQFDIYYNRIKKFSTLRELKSVGINIDEFYRTEFLITTEAEEKFNSLTVEQILKSVRDRIQLVENHNLIRTDSSSQYAGDGIDGLLDELATAPEVGIPMEGKMLTYATRGFRPGKMYMYSAPSGGGKALPNSTKIPLYNGTWKTVGDIRPGDELIDRYGNPTKVLKIFPQGQKEVYKVIFKDGREALCNDEHLWSYNTATQRSKANLYTKTLREIINEGANSNYKTTDGALKYLVPQNAPVQYPTRELKIDPYVMGLFLGDGSFRQHESNKTLQFSSSDIELVEAIAKCNNWIIKKGSENNYTYYFANETKNIFVEEFLQPYPELFNTYSHTKFIPNDYLIGSEEQRWELLRGLMDTDGSIDEKGRCSFNTISSQLKDDVILLARSLGLKVTCREDRRADKYTTGVCYDINIMGSKEQKLKLFKLSRKTQRAWNYYNNQKRSEKNDSNPIIDIQDCGYTEEMTCFLVDNDEHLFLMNDYIVTHNTRMMVGNACSLAFPRIENGKVVARHELEKVLFIATEMRADEIQTLILAWISGVNEEAILTNTMTEDEIKLVRVAAKIMKKYQENFLIECIPNPSIASLKAMISTHIISESIQYVFYDYIFSSPGLLEEFRGVNVREDVALMMLSNTLKEIAATYNVFLMTGSQLNGTWEGKTTRNANMIRGRSRNCLNTFLPVITGVRYKTC